MKSVMSLQTPRCLIQLQHKISSNSAQTRREQEITSSAGSSTHSACSRAQRHSEVQKWLVCSLCEGGCHKIHPKAVISFTLCKKDILSLYIYTP